MLLSETQLATWHLLLTRYAAIGQSEFMVVATVLQDLPAVEADRAGVPVARRTARHLLHIFDDLAETDSSQEHRQAAAEAARTIRTWEQFDAD